MDNFMDKLAQKLNAQEMIKANSAADAAQMNKLQSQMAEYDAALQEIRKAGLKNVEIADKLNQLIADATQQIEQLTKESIAKVEAAEVSGGNKEAVEKQLADGQTKMEQRLSETSENLEQRLSETSENLERKLAENQAQTVEKLAELAQSIQASKEEQLAELSKTTCGGGEEQFAEILQALQENQQEMQELIEKTQEYVHTEDVKVYRNVQAVIVEENSKQIEKITNAQSTTGVKLTASVVFSAIALVAILVDLGINLAQLLGLI